MLKGKRAGGRPTHVKSSKKGSKAANPKQQDIPGIDVDSRRIEAIEDAEDARKAASAALSSAHEDLEEAEQAVIDAMHDNGFSVKRKPTYTRAGWGSVVLQEKGEVKEKVKFISATQNKKSSKKKGDKNEE